MCSKNYALLGCYATSSGNFLPIFRDKPEITQKFSAVRCGKLLPTFREKPKITQNFSAASCGNLLPTFREKPEITQKFSAASCGNLLPTFQYKPEITKKCSDLTLSFFNPCSHVTAIKAVNLSVMIHLLTAIGLPPGGSTHLHTDNTRNNTNDNLTTQIQTNVEECGPCPFFPSFYFGICLTTEEKSRKTSVRVKKP
jgi:hypothetical protein